MREEPIVKDAVAADTKTFVPILFGKEYALPRDGTFSTCRGFGSS
jgi:hypothetical protein